MKQSDLASSQRGETSVHQSDNKEMEEESRPNHTENGPPKE